MGYWSMPLAAIKGFAFQEQTVLSSVVLGVGGGAVWVWRSLLYIKSAPVAIQVSTITPTLILTLTLTLTLTLSLSLSLSLRTQGPCAICDIRDPSETHLTLKSREISCVLDTHFCYQIVSKICTVCSSGAAFLFAKFQNDLTIER